MSRKQKTVSTERYHCVNKYMFDSSIFASCAQLQTTLQFIPNQLISFHFILLAEYRLLGKKWAQT